MNSPCKGCEKRQLGCHSICKEYAEYDAEMKQQREKRLFDSKFIDYSCKKHEQIERYRRQHKRR